MTVSIIGYLPFYFSPSYWSLFIVLLALLLGVLRFESSNLSEKKITLIALLTAISSGLRIIFAPIPSVQPSTFIIILTGAVFGAEVGFMVGILTPLLSNFFLGQGIYTPFMMAGWGVVGLLSGALYPRFKRKILFLYGISFLSGYIYGWVTDISMLIFYPPTFSSIILIYTMSFWFDTLHSAGNILFLHYIGGPIKGLLEKKKRKMEVRIL